MSNDAALPLQRQVINQLQSSEDVKTQMNGCFQIVDQSDNCDKFPKIVLGDTKSFAWQSATFDGQEHEVQLIVWNDEGGSDKAKSIASAIMGVLHNADFPIEGHALVDMQFEKSETRFKEEIDSYQTIIHFKALTVTD